MNPSRAQEQRQIAETLTRLPPNAPRVYEPWGTARHYDPSREGAGADFPKVFRYSLVERTDGRWALVDPLLPWNAATVGVFDSRSEAERGAGMTGPLRPDAPSPRARS